MLNDRQIVLAKAVARELALLNETSEGEEFERVINVLSFVNDVVERAHNVIKEFISSATEFIESMKKDNNKFKNNWYVPIKVNLPKAPYVTNYNLQFARNNL